MPKAQPLGFVALLLLLACGTAATAQRGRATPRLARICPDPAVRCRTSVEFQPYHLPFAVPADAVIWETEKFYAVILKSVRDESRGADCNVYVPEAERLAAQELFPHNKVFASRCTEGGDLFYTDVAEGSQFMAVYAGRTRAEAQAMLARVKATGRYSGANIRRMSTGFNGT
jgi:hypothetical protein